MKRRDDNEEPSVEEQRVEELIGRLRDEIPPPSDDELRALARSAAADERSLQPRRVRPGLTLRWAVASVIFALLVGSALGFGVGTSVARPALIPASEFGAFVIAGGAVSPETVSTRSCALSGSFLNVQIAGNVFGTYWGGIHRDVFAPIPARKSMVAVWSFGSQATGQPVLYGWVADRRSRVRSGCTARTARAPSRGDLRSMVRVKDGWAYGRRYDCRHGGRFVIQTEQLGSRTRMTIWMEKSGELVAIAEATRGSAWVRASKRCAERNI